MPADTIPARFFSQAKAHPDAPACYARVDGRWQMTTWQRRAERVERIARGLIGLGVPAGGATSILGYNRAEWVDWHIATMMIGANSSISPMMRIVTRMPVCPKRDITRSLSRSMTHEMRRVTTIEM